MTETSLAKTDSESPAQSIEKANPTLLAATKSRAPLTLNDATAWAGVIEAAGLIPKAAAQNERMALAQAVVKIMAGHAYDIDPIQSMRLFDIIDGKVKPGAEVQGMLIKRSGKYNYLKVGEHTGKTCTIRFFVKTDGGWKALGDSTYTWEIAEKAKLTSKDNYQKMPEKMLYARALTTGRLWYCPEVMDTGGYVDDFSDPGDLAAEAGQLTPAPYLPVNDADFIEQLDQALLEQVADAIDAVPQKERAAFISSIVGEGKGMEDATNEHLTAMLVELAKKAGAQGA